MADSSIGDKVSSLNIGTTIKDGLGKISDAASSGIKTASLKIKSVFERKDLPKPPVPKPTTSSSPTGAKQSKSMDKFKGMLVFPGDMKYYTKFSFKAYDKKIVTAGAKDLPTVTIVLPMPNNLKENFSVDYETPAMGPIAGPAVDAIRKAVETGSVTGVLGSGEQMLAGAAATIQDSMKKGGMEKLAGATGLLTGTAPNPQLAVLFSNIGLRTHSFSYKFAPKSLKEVNDLRQIVWELKRRMLPGMAAQGTTLFTFPDVCDIEFGPDKTKPYKILQCVMDSFEVNYTPMGSPAFFKDGDPVMVEISMTFKETKPFTRMEIDDFKATEGRKAPAVAPAPVPPAPVDRPTRGGR